MLELIQPGPYPQLRRRAGASSSCLCIRILYLSHHRSNVVVLAPSIQQNPTMCAYLQACLSLIVVMFGVAAQHATGGSDRNVLSAPCTTWAFVRTWRCLRKAFKHQTSEQQQARTQTHTHTQTDRDRGQRQRQTHAHARRRTNNQRTKHKPENTRPNEHTVLP